MWATNSSASEFASLIKLSGSQVGYEYSDDTRSRRIFLKTHRFLFFFMLTIFKVFCWSLRQLKISVKTPQ